MPLSEAEARRVGILRKAGMKPKSTTRKPKLAFDAQAHLVRLVRDAGLPAPVLEAKLVPGRDFRCDLAWESLRVVCEIEGGVFIRGGGGRHQRAKGYMEDMVKYNALAVQGYCLVRVTVPQVKTGEALTIVRTALVMSLSRKMKGEAW